MIVEARNKHYQGNQGFKTTIWFINSLYFHAVSCWKKKPKSDNKKLYTKIFDYNNGKPVGQLIK